MLSVKLPAVCAMRSSVDLMPLQWHVRVYSLRESQESNAIDSSSASRHFGGTLLWWNGGGRVHREACSFTQTGLNVTWRDLDGTSCPVLSRPIAHANCQSDPSNQALLISSLCGDRSKASHGSHSSTGSRQVSGMKTQACFVMDINVTGESVSTVLQYNL